MLNLKKVVNGNYKILFSNRYLLVSPKPLELDFEIDGSSQMVVTFTFSETDGKEPNMKFASSDIDNGFKFDFTLENFNSSLGTGTKVPISLLRTKDEKKEICVAFFAYKVGSISSHELDVSFYEGEKNEKF